MFAQDPGTGFTLWLTGMQGAGKHTLAREVVNRLRRLGRPVEHLDGPDWEKFIGRGPGATKEERDALVRRAGFIARALTRAGGFSVVSYISPYREVRDQLRREIGRFVEVFVDCPIETLLARDVKGEYQKAMRGEIKNFIGITDPYEPPGAPEVRYDSSKQSVDEGASLVLEALVKEGVLSAGDVGLSRAPKKEKRKAPRKAPPSILFTPEMLALPKPAPKPEKKPAAKVEAKPAPVEAKPAKAEAKPAKAEAKPAKAEAKPAKAETKPAKAEAKPAKAEAKPAKVEAKKVARIEPKAAKVEPKKAARIEPKAAGRSDRKAAKAEAKPAARKPARIEPKAAKKPEPKAAGKAKKAALKAAPNKAAARTARAAGSKRR